MAQQEVQSHVLVVGHGRSGTNMVLDLFDRHRNTVCRNEPNELHGTAFTALGDPMFPDDTPADFEMAWRAALHATFRASGARDRFGTDKDYFRSALLARLGQAVMSRQRLRRAVLPRSAGRVVEEWPAPGLYCDLDARADARPILKLLLTPAWVNRAHDVVPTQRVVHVLRHPQDFIQSWWGRYVTGIGGGPEQVFADNQPSLARILAHFDRSGDLPQAFSLAALVRSELWRWRYINEVMINHLQGDPRYLIAPYSAVMRDRLDWAERLYRFADLNMTSDTRAAITAMQNTLFKARKPDGLDPDMVATAVQEVIADSPHHALLLNKAATG